MNQIQSITIQIRNALKHLEVHELKAIEDYAQRLRWKLEREALKRLEEAA